MLSPDQPAKRSRLPLAHGRAIGGHSGRRGAALEDILLKQGWDPFKAEFDKEKPNIRTSRTGFPTRLSELILTAYFDLLASERGAPPGAHEFNAAQYPRNLRAWYGLAEVAKTLGDIDLALGAYETLLRTDPLIADARPLSFPSSVKKLRDSGVRASPRSSRR
ncbi:MAG: hypothetical protein M0C28_04875 [Candidatus Moduliflexus flocculans]|nr:hypothetical protein [Candidatus Moduliflexus flocculans]